MSTNTSISIKVGLLVVGVFLFLTAFVSPSIARAQFDESAVVSTYGDCRGAGGFVPLECFKGSRKLEDAYNTTELGPFLQKIFVGMISLGAILAVLRLAWGGFVYMSSDLWSSKGHAKEVITDAFLGLFLLLAVWLILYQINPQILELRVESRAPASTQSQIPSQQTDNWFF
jgi:hypothetical protein